MDLPLAGNLSSVCLYRRWPLLRVGEERLILIRRALLESPFIPLSLADDLDFYENG